MANRFARIYQALVFKQPLLVLLVSAIIVAALSQFAGNFRLDASSDSLVLENDKSLKYFREVISKYDTADFLVLTYSPTDDLFSDAVLDDLNSLRTKLMALENTKSMISILDVPLVQSPPVTLTELNTAPQYLLSEKTDRKLAKEELRTSQLYRDLLVSDDYSTTAIIISLNSDAEVTTLHSRRNALRQLRADTGLSELEKAELVEVTQLHQQKAAVFQQRQNLLIKTVREISAEHKDQAQIFLGGLPMIVTDSISFIEDDVVVFGAAAVLVIIFILTIAFRQLGWVVMPLITCGVTGYISICLLGWLNWPISVVSSNFLSLLLIITLSLNIHLIVRYRELSKLHPDSTQFDLLRDTVESKFIPCLYTALTTIVAFASLIVSGIRPVIDFGWIMCLGIVVAMLTTFTIFPALAMLMKPRKVAANRDAISQWVLNAAQSLHKRVSPVTLAFGLAGAAAVYGMANLSVENRFIDYFKPDTEIYQGMYEIDSKLGGTTPLDIIIDAPVNFLEEHAQFEAEQAALEEATGEDLGEDDWVDDWVDEEDWSAEDDGFGDEGSSSNESSEADVNLAVTSYWFNVEGLKKVKAIQASLEALPATGKVLSLASSMSVFDNLKDAKPLDNIDLAFMYNVLSESNKQTLFVPYMSPDGNQIHINMRVFETQKGLDRNQLISDVRQLLIEEHGIADEQINISGMLVLYNNMLNSLFSSQILTLGTVFLVIFLMFIILFKRLKLALITIVPNVFSAAVVLGLMGIFSIPLDLMTITIAAISVGIAVDNSIHFVHRFRDEFADTQNYSQSIATATNNIGQAMFYTTLVITAGFLIMVFSNFVPTMYFGMLTALAMVTALLANLIMLPMLIAKFKP